MSDEMRKRLVREINEKWSRMQEIQRAAEGEDRDWSAEERTNWDSANTDLTQKTADLERLDRAAQLEAAHSTDAVPAERAEGPADTAEQRAKVYEDAFGSYMRGGLDRLTIAQRDLLMQNYIAENRAQSVGTNSAGGYLVPPGYRTVMSEAMKMYGGMLNLANVITTSEGNPLQWPTNDDTANKGAILAENTAMSAASVTFGSRTLGAYVYTSNLALVSLQLLGDSAFDLDTWLPGKLGERIGRAVADHLIAGTGSGQPEGVATNAVAGVTGAVSATPALTYDNLIDLEHSIDPAYRASGNCRFVFNDTTLSLVRKLKDTTGRPLWQPVPVPGMEATINGLPYTIDQGMASPAAAASSVLFGDFKAGYIVRQVWDMQMVRLAERYAEALQVGFFGFSRLDAKPDDPKAVRAFVHGAAS